MVSTLTVQKNKIKQRPVVEQFPQFPIQVKEMSDKETKEYHLKKLYDLSIKSIGEIPHLEEPNVEQKQWILRKMHGSTRSWERWFVVKYFTEQQKKELGLTAEDIAGKGMR